MFPQKKKAKKSKLPSLKHFMVSKNVSKDLELSTKKNQKTSDASNIKENNRFASNPSTLEKNSSSNKCSNESNKVSTVVKSSTTNLTSGKYRGIYEENDGMVKNNTKQKKKCQTFIYHLPWNQMNLRFLHHLR